jgi:hypothetical protein
VRPVERSPPGAGVQREQRLAPPHRPVGGDGAFERLQAALEQARAGGGDGVEILRRRGLAFGLRGLAHPRKYRVLFLGPDLVPPQVSRLMPIGADPPRRGAAGARCFAPFRGQAAELVAQGRLVDRAPNLLAQLLWAAVQGPSGAPDHQAALFLVGPVRR